MRVLLDECLDRRLKGHLYGHDVDTVHECGWSGKTNGELLALASGRFDVFLTADQNLPYQQNLSRATLAVVVVRGGSGGLGALLLMVPRILETLRSIRAGEFRLVE